MRQLCSRLHVAKKGQETAFRQKRWPAFKELATGGADDVGNRETLVRTQINGAADTMSWLELLSGAGTLACGLKQASSETKAIEFPASYIRPRNVKS